MNLPSEIVTITGMDLFSTFLARTAPSRNTFMTGFDELLESETHSSNLRRGDLVQIQGVASSGKTQLLMFFAMTALLPETWTVKLGPTITNVRLGGKNHAVFWLDATQRLDVRRLAALLRHHITSQVDCHRSFGVLAVPYTQIEDLVESCLSHLHIFTPSSTLQLACTLQLLPDVFRSLSRDSWIPEISYVIIDGISEFVWRDQLDRELSKEKDYVSSLRFVVQALAHVRKQLSPVFFVSEWVLRDNVIPHRSNHGLPFYTSHLDPPWPQISSAPPRVDERSLDAPNFPQSKDPAIPIKYHITAHPPPLATASAEAAAKRSLGQSGEKGMIGFTAVLRAAGGKEIGDWQYDILPDAVCG